MIKNNRIIGGEGYANDKRGKKIYSSYYDRSIFIK